MKVLFPSLNLERGPQAQGFSHPVPCIQPSPHREGGSPSSEWVYCSVGKQTEAVGSSTKSHIVRWVFSLSGFCRDMSDRAVIWANAQVNVLLRGRPESPGIQPLRWCPVSPTSRFSWSCAVSSHIVSGLIGMTNKIQQIDGICL